MQSSSSSSSSSSLDLQFPLGSRHPLEQSLAGRGALPLAQRDANAAVVTSKTSAAKLRTSTAGGLGAAAAETSDKEATMHQQQQSIVETFTVMARVRPRLPREARSENLRVVDDFITVTGDVSYAPSTRTTKHKFDRVFDRGVEQADVYASVAPLIDSALEGFNTTVFAYGQTGTGKTHTMLGVDIWSLGERQESVQEAIRSVARNQVQK